MGFPVAILRHNSSARKCPASKRGLCLKQRVSGGKKGTRPSCPCSPPSRSLVPRTWSAPAQLTWTHQVLRSEPHGVSRPSKSWPPPLAPRPVLSRHSANLSGCLTPSPQSRAPQGRSQEGLARSADAGSGRREVPPASG